MKYLRHFFVEGRYLGASPCSREFVHEISVPPEPIAYFCPHCGELWARAAIESASGIPQTQQWRVVTIGCRKHSGSHFSVPGSLDLSWKKGWLESLPDEAVKWEFQRQIEQYFKES